VLSHRLSAILRGVWSYAALEVSKATRWIILSNHTLENGMNKDQVKGRVEQVKGKIKKVTGSVVGNKTLEQKGKAQEIVGKVEANLGDLKSDLKKGG
jgi:uncharacterized protein YjbJ (UPF0337 family)